MQHPNHYVTASHGAAFPYTTPPSYKRGAWGPSPNSPAVTAVPCAPQPLLRATCWGPPPTAPTTCWGPAPIYTRTKSGACSELHSTQSVCTETESQLFSSRNSAQIKHRDKHLDRVPATQLFLFPFLPPPPKLGGSLISVVGCYQMERRGVPRTDPWLVGELGAALPTTR